MIETAIPDAAGRAAFHCDELMSRAQKPLDQDLEFARFARGFAEQASTQLAELCDERGLVIETSDTSLTSVSDWYDSFDKANHHVYYSIGQKGCGMLVSVPIGELVAQFDRILGGTGDLDAACTVLPASALRFAQQFEQRMAATLSRTIDRSGIAAMSSGEEPETVAPFGASESVWVATLNVSSAKNSRLWNVRLAASQAMITELIGKPAELPAAGPTIGARGLSGSAIGDVDLPLRAVLVDVAMSVARLSSLETGIVIPVAVNRNVPLLTGDLTIAHGCVGELDDRVALELTQAFLKE